MKPPTESHEQPLAAELVGEPAREGQDDGVRHQVGRERPGGLVDRGGEVPRDVRERDVHDRGVQHLHEGGGHHGDRHDPGVDDPRAKGGVGGHGAEAGPGVPVRGRRGSRTTAASSPRVGVDHEVVEAGIEPVLAEVPADVGRPLAVGLLEDQLDVRPRAEARAEAAQPLLPRRVDEDVEDVGPAAQEALAAPADDDAAAGRGRLLDDAPAEDGQAVGVHHVVLVDDRHRLEAAVPEGVPDAPHPGVDVLVEPLGEIGVDPRRLRDALDERAVEELVAEARGEPASRSRHPRCRTRGRR